MEPESPFERPCGTDNCVPICVCHTRAQAPENSRAFRVVSIRIGQTRNPEKTKPGKDMGIGQAQAPVGAGKSHARFSCFFAKAVQATQPYCYRFYPRA
jgi:hypothetical protein